MYVANEGVMVAFVGPETPTPRSRRCAPCPDVRRQWRSARSGRASEMVLVETAFGGQRVMDLLAGDPLPRIC